MSNEELLNLLSEIDNDGEDLTPWEIEFVAKLIDGGVTSFSSKQASTIKRIHAERVS